MFIEIFINLVASGLFFVIFWGQGGFVALKSQKAGGDGDIKEAARIAAKAVIFPGIFWVVFSLMQYGAGEEEAALMAAKAAAGVQEISCPRQVSEMTALRQMAQTGIAPAVCAVVRK